VLPDDQKKQLLSRLRRIEGQAGGLVRMVEADKYCIDVLQQMAAVQGALAQASKMLIRSHLETCVVDAFKSRKTEERERVISELVDLFARINRAGPTK
jgi:DNA-binding FrmR family transcriptional regulator